jgi:hypothetical protein
MSYAMNEPTLLTKAETQTNLNLDAYERLVANAEFYAGLNPPMNEGEQVDAHMAFMQYWGQRHLLGDLYRNGRLNSKQLTHLADLDRQLLEHAAMIETVYGASLRQLVRDLFAWGTPLAEQPGSLRIETTTTALAELAGVTDV